MAKATTTPSPKTGNNASSPLIDEGIMMVKDIPSADHSGETRIAESVVATIAGVAAREIDGVYQLGGGAISQAVGRVTGKADTTLGVNAEVGKKEVAIDMVMIIEYDYNIYDVTQKVREVVAQRIEHMTHLFVKEVNIDVVGIHYDTKDPKPIKQGRVE